MSKAINLGRKPEKIGRLPAMPHEDEDKTYYPTLYLGDVKDSRILDLPDEGECTIKYKIRHREHRESKHEDDKKAKRSCSVDMDIISIEPPEGKKNGNGAKDSDGGARKAFSDYFKDK